MTDTPSLALSIRIEPVRRGAYRGRRRHDLREGPQPGYVDATRSDLNSVIIVAPTTGVIRAESVRRRSGRNDVRRAMRDDVAIATAGVITFGRGLQAHVDALPHDDQDALYRAVADAVADHCGSTLAGLAVHRDEVAPHAHLWMPSFALDGRPISHRLSRGDMSRLQDVAMEAARPWLPMIQPPVRKAARIERGDDVSATYHRSVRQLHADLPCEISAAQAKVDEMLARVSGLEARETRNAKEEKRLAVYRKRLVDREGELRRFHEVQRNRSNDLDQREAEIDAIVDRAASVAAENATEAIAAVIDGRIVPHPSRPGRMRVDPDLHGDLGPIWRAIAPTIARVSRWWEGLRDRVDALPDPERRILIAGSDDDDPSP